MGDVMFDAGKSNLRRGDVAKLSGILLNTPPYV
jgi:hypothetical protein